MSVGLFLRAREDAGERGSTSTPNPKERSPCAAPSPHAFKLLPPTALVKSGLHCTKQPNVPHQGTLEGSGVLHKNKQDRSGEKKSPQLREATSRGNSFGAHCRKTAGVQC